MGEGGDVRMPRATLGFMGLGRRSGALVRLGAATIGGAWVAAFGWDEPRAAIVGALLTALGIALLPARRRIGVAAILLASLAALVAGAPWGQVDMMLPLAIALFVVGRTERSWIPGAVAMLIASLSCALRGGFGLVEFGLMLAICACMWSFGVLVRHRALSAYRAIAESRRLAAENPVEAAAKLAAEDRERLAEQAVLALRTAILRMQRAAQDAIARPGPDVVREVHGRGVAAVDELRRLLDLLRDGPPAGPGTDREARGPGGLVAVAPPRGALTTVLFGLFLLAALALVPVEQRGLGLTLAYAATAIAFGLRSIAPFAACLVAAAGSLALVILPPTSSDALLPVAAGYVHLAWTISSGPPAHTSRSDRRAAVARGWAGLGLLLACGLVLSLSYGPHGVGFVLLVFVTTVLAGIAWREQDMIFRRAESRSERLQADIDRETDAAVRAERLRLARELHDVASHTVGGMVMQAGAAGALVEREPGQALDALRTVIDAGERALAEAAELRSALSGARDRSETRLLGGGMLRAELERLVAEARARGDRVESRIGPLPEHPASADALFHVVREGLVNAERHAPGARVEVSVDAEGGAFVVRVRDHGIAGHRAASAADRIGTGRDAGRGTGHGLAGLAERMVACDGGLEARSVPGAGFLLEGRLPVPGMEGAPR